MKIHRRDLLATFGALFFSLRQGIAKSANESPLFASAYMDRYKRFGIAILDHDGHIIDQYPLPSRGHGIVSTRSSSWVVTFARRPGTFAFALRRDREKEPVLFKTPLHTHFYGHGAFSKDEKFLFTTENEYENGTGLIGIYNAVDSFARVGEFPSYGIGPHEIILMPDGRTLCVANGGIVTHPDTGRRKLNLHTMQSSIAFIDSHHGKLITRLDVPEWLHHLSLRHMAVDDRQTVWLGGQYQGAHQGDDVPLIAKANLEEGLTFPSFDPSHIMSMKNYIGSVASSADGQKIAFTSPKGNSFLVIDSAGGIFSKERVEAVCGVASFGKSFAISGMNGQWNHRNYETHWDNHMIAL
ncbi:MAG: DUF1513 domain-containing protein [Pseudomonadota bacterium]